MGDDLTNLIRQALDHVGYHEAPATEAALRQCLGDYVDSGQFPDLEDEDLTQIPAERIARRFLRLR